MTWKDHIMKKGDAVIKDGGPNDIVIACVFTPLLLHLL